MKFKTDKTVNTVDNEIIYDFIINKKDDNSFFDAVEDEYRYTEKLIPLFNVIYDDNISLDNISLLVEPHEYKDNKIIYTVYLNLI